MKINVILKNKRCLKLLNFIRFIGKLPQHSTADSTNALNK